MIGSFQQCGVFFKSFGLVVDVYVPQKRTKGGRRFGLVRYRGVMNEHKLLAEVSDAWAGHEKLVIHRARFDRSLFKMNSTMLSQPFWKMMAARVVVVPLISWMKKAPTKTRRW